MELRHAQHQLLGSKAARLVIYVVLLAHNLSASSCHLGASDAAGGGGGGSRGSGGGGASCCSGGGGGGGGASAAVLVVPVALVPVMVVPVAGAGDGAGGGGQRRNDGCVAGVGGAKRPPAHRIRKNKLRFMRLASIILLLGSVLDFGTLKETMIM